MIEHISIIASCLTGGYMFAGTDATLLSPLYNTSTPSCLTFWYHMRGSNPGSLEVTTRSDNPTQLPTISGMTGDIWTFRSLDIPTGSGRVAFTATGSNGGAPYIAVDDVTFSAGSCGTRGTIPNHIKSNLKTNLTLILTYLHVIDLLTLSCRMPP